MRDSVPENLSSSVNKSKKDGSSAEGSFRFPNVVVGFAPGPGRMGAGGCGLLASMAELTVLHFRETEYYKDLYKIDRN